MPKIYDNIEQRLLPALQQTLEVSYRADFCVGYFNLRGWRHLDGRIDQWTGGDDYCCRLLVGMNRDEDASLRATYRFRDDDEEMDNQTAARFRREKAESFRRQLMIGAPNNADEEGLRRLARQIWEGKVKVKLYLRESLHAKLYLLFRQDIATPIIGYMGSSNLTLSGLSGQGELNIDVLEQDAANKLAQWFNARWNDRFCLDISEELAQIIEESWAGEKLNPPYYIYLKMAYHLSREARAGLSEFTIPADFRGKLFDFQTAAVKIAARHLNQRGGVLIGDVVGLGKTMMATAVAKIFEEDYLMDTLIICPKNLVKMWDSYREQYGLKGSVMSVTQVQRALPELKRYRLVLIDESHNLRNPEGKRYKAIKDYIQANDSRCILLSATPYNKSYLDLSSQLRLFVPDTADLGIRPERLLREMGEVEFVRQHQANLRSLSAFEKSGYADDWRELMRLFMVRRTRSFIRDNYAHPDDDGRKYLRYPDGSRAYFPTRRPRRVAFTIDEGNANDQYARLYAADVVETINDLNLPRYGLGNYVVSNPRPAPNQREKQLLENLSRGGKRLMGFSRTGLFKRLESSGYAFLLSVERHILRNYIFIHALENGRELPIGTQDVEMLDTRYEDADADALNYDAADFHDEVTDEAGLEVNIPAESLHSEADFKAKAAEAYNLYSGRYKKRFKWIRPDLFNRQLLKDLQADAENLLLVLQECRRWNPAADAKLDALHQLLTRQHPDEKVLVFSQFADTVHYLAEQLQARGVRQLGGVTGDSADPTGLAWRFSPVSNGRREQTGPAEELRVLIATDVLSEGQNLQDAHIVVNYDLPWAIIRLIQRAGRVDRIGQQASEILGYTFWPADGVERIIRLRERLRQRLRENAEVVGTDEEFFEGESDQQALLNLYHERAGVLDDEVDTEVDLVSYAFQIWKNAIDANPRLKATIEALPDVSYSTKALPPATGGTASNPAGVLVFMQTEEGNSSLAWINEQGESVTESQFAILRAAECSLDTPALERQENHHDLVRSGVEHIVREGKFVGGQLGRPSGARFKVFERLKHYAERLRGTLLERLPPNQTLLKAIEQIYQFPLRESAKEKLNRQLRSDASDEQLTELVVSLYEDDDLCLVQEEQVAQEPRIICSLGLVAEQGNSREL